MLISDRSLIRCWAADGSRGRSSPRDDDKRSRFVYNSRGGHTRLHDAFSEDICLSKQLEGELTQLVPVMDTSAQPWQSKDWVLVKTGNWPTSYTVTVLTMPSVGMQEVLVEAV